MSPVRDLDERFRFCFEQDDILAVAHGDIDLQVRFVPAIACIFPNTGSVPPACDGDRLLYRVADEFARCRRVGFGPDKPEDGFASSGSSQ